MERQKASLETKTRKFKGKREKKEGKWQDETKGDNKRSK